LAGSSCKDLSSVTLTVEAQVELFAADEKRVIDVSRNDVGFIHVEPFEGGVEVGAGNDLLELVDFLEQENAVALRLVVGLDYPGGVGVLLKLVQEDGVLVWIGGKLLGKVKVMGKKSMCAPPQF
jgi:hypothetical protein